MKTKHLQKKNIKSCKKTNFRLHWQSWGQSSTAETENLHKDLTYRRLPIKQRKHACNSLKGPQQGLLNSKRYCLSSFHHYKKAGIVSILRHLRLKCLWRFELTNLYNKCTVPTQTKEANGAMPHSAIADRYRKEAKKRSISDTTSLLCCWKILWMLHQVAKKQNCGVSSPGHETWSQSIPNTSFQVQIQHI